MTAQESSKRDIWSHQAYSSAASYVPQLTTRVVQMLDPKPDDTILDIGCGDGVLTAKLAAASCKRIVGLDASASFIATAQETVGAKHSNTEFVEMDCRQLPVGSTAAVQRDTYDKAFSNAAMHWILRDESTRHAFFTSVLGVLKPGGVFVFEMGGAGNVAEVHTAMRAVLHLRYGVSLERLDVADPWFFPSAAWMRAALMRAGFEIEVVETEYRPTRATERSSDGSGGLEGWLRLMGANFYDLIDEKDRMDAVRLTCDVLQAAVTRVEDGGQYLGYCRLRGMATKPK